LAELNIFGPECIKNHRGKEWLDKIYSDWANTLDMLVWLDTSDSALMKRVRTRRKWHLIKEQSDQEAIDFNASFRETYQRLISMLSVSANSPTVIGFNTGQESLDAIVDKLLLALDINNHTVSIPR
jgi:thymidylate kinase